MDHDDPSFDDEDSRYIEGVFNYCDRWCERCELSHRCRSFAMGEELAREQREAQERSDGLLRSLESILGHALEIVEREGPTLPPREPAPESDEESPSLRRIRQSIAADPIAAASYEYGDRAMAWLGRSDDILAAHARRLNDRIATGAEQEPLAAEAARIAEAVEVVGWYSLQIHVKLRRARPRQREEGAEKWEEWEVDPVQNDANGSAKVALIGIDRSIAAWGVLWETLGDPTSEILAMLVDLAQLRREVEIAFPHARAFVRPGFDGPTG